MNCLMESCDNNTMRVPRIHGFLTKSYAAS